MAECVSSLRTKWKGQRRQVTCSSRGCAWGAIHVTTLGTKGHGGRGLPRNDMPGRRQGSQTSFCSSFLHGRNQGLCGRMPGVASPSGQGYVVLMPWCPQYHTALGHSAAESGAMEPGDHLDHRTNKSLLPPGARNGLDILHSFLQEHSPQS